MKLKFWNSPAKTPTTISVVSLPKLELIHTVTHTVKYLPKPKPTRLQIQIVNEVGQRWWANPMIVTGDYAGIVSFPLSWVTGKTEDNSQQVRLEVMMEYEKP